MVSPVVAATIAACSMLWLMLPGWQDRRFSNKLHNFC
jgi:hypothetical protein